MAVTQRRLENPVGWYVARYKKLQIIIKLLLITNAITFKGKRVLTFLEKVDEGMKLYLSNAPLILNFRNQQNGLKLWKHKKVITRKLLFYQICTREIQDLVYCPV